MTSPTRILVTRTDKLGDFMLVWPALALLRAALPAARIDVLVGPGGDKISQLCRYVDDVLIDRGQPIRELANEIKSNKYDAALSFFVSRRVAAALWFGRVPFRLAPATKIYQVLFQGRQVQRRSKSLMPEYEYNLDLVRALLLHYGIIIPQVPGAPYLKFSRRCLSQRLKEVENYYGLTSRSKLIIIHPGSGGSARNITPKGYAALANKIAEWSECFFLITAGPGEETVALDVSDAIESAPSAVHFSDRGIGKFAQLIAVSDMFISGSTGPLHIAGALNVKTVGFYPRRRSSTALRWQTVNNPSNRLAFSPPAWAGESDMDAINLSLAASIIREKHLRGNE